MSGTFHQDGPRIQTMQFKRPVALIKGSVSKPSYLNIVQNLVDRLAMVRHEGSLRVGVHYCAREHIRHKRRRLLCTTLGINGLDPRKFFGFQLLKTAQA